MAVIRPWLERLYWKMEHRIVPGLESSQESYLAALERLVRAKARWLDLGCGSSVVPAWKREAEEQLVARAGRVVGIDRDLRSLRKHATIENRVCGDIAELPFPDAAFDLVTANMVVEHMRDPVRQFVEIRRVLAPGGVFVCHTPNARGYPTLAARLVPDTVKRWLARGLEGRRTADVYRTYYRANSRGQLERLATLAQLRLRNVLMTASSAVLAIVPPLAFFELLWIRALRRPNLEALRPTMIATFTRAPD